MLKELDKAVGSIKSSGLQKSIFFIIIGFNCIQFCFMVSQKRESAQASIAMGVAKVLFCDCKLMRTHSNI